MHILWVWSFIGPTKWCKLCIDYFLTVELTVVTGDLWANLFLGFTLLVAVNSSWLNNHWPSAGRPNFGQILPRALFVNDSLARIKTSYPNFSSCLPSERRDTTVEARLTSEELWIRSNNDSTELLWFYVVMDTALTHFFEYAHR